LTTLVWPNQTSTTLSPSGRPSKSTRSLPDATTAELRRASPQVRSTGTGALPATMLTPRQRESVLTRRRTPAAMAARAPRPSSGGYSAKSAYGSRQG